MKTLVLYSTLGCHLCDVAKSLVWSEIRQQGFTLEEVDIADSDDLMEKYALRIPVLLIQGEENDLGWPFDSGQLRDYLRISPPV